MRSFGWGALAFIAALAVSVPICWEPSNRTIHPLAHLVACGLYVLGLSFLIVAVPMVVEFFLTRFWRELEERGDFIHTCEQSLKYLGYALLLGLQFFIAAEIVETVAVAFHPASTDRTALFFELGQLGAIILLRAFLGFVLAREISDVR